MGPPDGRPDVALELSAATFVLVPHQDRMLIRTTNPIESMNLTLQ